MFSFLTSKWEPTGDAKKNSIFHQKTRFFVFFYKKNTILVSHKTMMFYANPPRQGAIRPSRIDEYLNGIPHFLRFFGKIEISLFSRLFLIFQTILEKNGRSFPNVCRYSLHFNPGSNRDKRAYTAERVNWSQKFLVTTGRKCVFGATDPCRAWQGRRSFIKNLSNLV